MNSHKIALLLAVVLTANSLPGAERTWDGTFRVNDWSSAANWVGSVAPVAGDSLRFPAAAGHLENVNDYPAGAVFSAITYAGAGYTAEGNSIGLSNGLSLTHSGNTFFHLPITLRDDQTFSVSQAAANLYLYGNINLNNQSLNFDSNGDTIIFGNISGDRFNRGALRKLGAGQLLVMQHLTYDSLTVVNGGSFRVDYSISNSLVTVNAGGTLTGLGKVGGIRANSGGSVQPGGATPQYLTSVGDVELNAGSTLNIRINGPTEGLNYDQLRVQGAVTLGGNLNLMVGYLPAVGTEFTIIDNDGTDDVIGTFAGMPEGHVFFLNGRPFRISYGARFGGIFGRENDVTIEAIPARSVWDAGGGLNNLWSQPLNWEGDAIPLPGDDIEFVNTNSFSTTMVTTNDFPAGRLFGSLFLPRGKQSIVGNPAQFDGRIETLAPSILSPIDIHLALTLRGGVLHTSLAELNLRGPITLSGNQTFRVVQNASNVIVYPSLLNVYGDLTLNGHDLIFDVDSTPAPARIPGWVYGPGELIKRGPERLTVAGGAACAITVDEGLLIIESPSSAAGPTTVKNSTILQAQGSFQDLEVQSGATFVPVEVAGVSGQARLLSGSTLSISIVTNYAYKLVGGSNATFSISGCHLSLSLDPAVNHTASFVIISPHRTADPVTGTFAGLPEGAVFVHDGRALTITYHGGDDDNQVVIHQVNAFVWDGGGADARWSTAANWSPDSPPVPRTDLVFPAVSKRAVVNDLASGTTFDRLSFQAPSYSVTGNPFVLTGPVMGNYNGEVVISANLGLNNAVDLTNSARLRLEGSVTGGFTKVGPATLHLAGTTPNFVSAAIDAGLLELDKSGTNAVSNLDIRGGVVRLLNDHQISDSGQVEVRAGGRLELNGQTDAINTLRGAGTVELTERFLRFGRLTVKSGDFAGELDGTGTFTKTGPGLLILTGVSPMTGTTILDEGELRMDGIQTNSTIRLDGGILTGRGFVGHITANSGGTVAPGFGGAQYESALHCRNVTLNPATTFRPVLTSSSPDFEGHKLQVAGSVILGGSQLAVDLYTTFKPTNSASFVIIDNDGNDAINGTFAGLPEGATIPAEGVLFRISYAGGTGNDVVLTRVPAPPSNMSTVAKMPNGQMRVSGLGIPGLIYTIQATTNLIPVIQWTQIGTTTAATDGYFHFFQNPTALPQRFYRAISP